MATRDENGYIRYSQEELERVPSYEERTAGREPRIAGLGFPALAALAGGIAGTGIGPGATLAGVAAGKVLGDQVARATGVGPDQGSADVAGRETGNLTALTRGPVPAEQPQTITEAGARATLQALDRDLREEEVDRMRRGKS